MKKTVHKETIKANIDVHAALANAGEYNKSPHFRIENQDKVEGIIKRLILDSPAPKKAKLLDLGCGTGFILHLASRHVAEAHGVDITEAMMSQVDTSLPNLNLSLIHI